MSIELTTATAAEINAIKTSLGLENAQDQPAEGAFQDGDKTKIDGITSPIIVTDNTARLALSNGVVGATYVTQTTENTSILFFLIAEDESLESSWLKIPYSTEDDGTIVVNMELSDFDGLVADEDAFGQVHGIPVIGDGVKTGGNRLSLRLDHPFTITNTGGGSIQSDDGIPKLYDWDDIYTSVMNAPEFYSSTNLTDLILGSKVTSIVEGEFYTCSSLTGTLVIPDACVTISVDYGYGFGAFENCSGIEKLVCGSGLNLIFNSSFRNCYSLATVLLNEGLTELGSYAFGSCAITTIDLPSTITDMGDSCFRSCSSLATVNCYATTAPTLNGSNHFLSTSATQIHVPVGATGYGTTFAGLTVVADL